MKQKNLEEGLNLDDQLTRELDSPNLQRDPLGYIDSLNAFSYVLNNPVNWVDPMGLLTLAPPGPWYANPWYWVVTLGGWAAYEAGRAWNRNPPSWPDWFPGTETDTSGGRNFCPVQNQKDEGDNSSSENQPGRRRRNRIPDRGQPGSVEWNAPGTTGKKYGEDGWVTKEWNSGHPDHDGFGSDDHIHDYEPQPENPTGRPKRKKPRKPNEDDKRDFGK